MAAAVAWWEAHVDQPRLLWVTTGDLTVRHRPDLVEAMGITIPATDLLGQPIGLPDDPQRVPDVYRNEAAAVGTVGRVGVARRAGVGAGGGAVFLGHIGDAQRRDAGVA